MAVGLLVPLDVDQAISLVGSKRDGIGAVGPVHTDPTATGDEADDPIGRDWGTASRQSHQQVVESLHVDAYGPGVSSRTAGL